MVSTRATTELRVRAFGVLTPTGCGPRLTVSIDTVQLHRTPDGRVTRSRRLGPMDHDDESSRLCGLVLREAGGLGDEVRNVVAEVHEREYRRPTATVVARVDTIAGPVLVGAAGGPDVALPRPALPVRLSAEPAGWRGLPVVLQPAVAAVIVAAAATALTTPTGRETARRRAGNRLLPDLTLVDKPASWGVDDRGHDANSLTLLDKGVLRPPGEMIAGIPRGRAMWHHDMRAFVTEPVRRLEVQTVELPPRDAIELVWCIEDSRPRMEDGELRLRCLARDPEGKWFSTVLRGKPLLLLRHVRGGHGPARCVFGDSEVTTPALVFGPTADLEESGRGSLAVL
ncbi:hypothetical protein Lesp02_12500 [Lentzea sp. NBRC 105346]|uniref:hypothetical protein n=1 Tax=Lentzea sp. NBRC 105346 TaxID=3032205 RepID=UPI0024A0030B|nr:hypothetical protein [Lentzea sp. NBRC 105346]GLZ29060.1 hypothetical protein Lesp02_12500 [Lentzea sp. NBRC 105346]